MTVIAHWEPAEIRALRAAHRLSLRQWERHTGIWRDVQCRWETGRETPQGASKARLDRILFKAPLDVEERFHEILALASERAVSSPA